jgi:hypothetical protein
VATGKIEWTAVIFSIAVVITVIVLYLWLSGTMSGDMTQLKTLFNNFKTVMIVALVLVVLVFLGLLIWGAYLLWEHFQNGGR